MFGITITAVLVFFIFEAGQPRMETFRGAFTAAPVPAPEKIPSVHVVPVDYAAILKAFRGKDIEFVPTEEKIIALTIDAGGNADGVAALAETLTRLHVPATFFLTGKFMEKFPDAIAALAGAPGGEFANHSYAHLDLTKLTGEGQREEIKNIEMIARERGIVLAPFFRFPYGARTAETITATNELGYTAVRWTVDSLGWQGMRNGRSVQFVVDRVASGARTGAIVLMHAGSAADKSTLDADALSEVIAQLSGQGYRFVTLSELFDASTHGTVSP